MVRSRSRWRLLAGILAILAMLSTACFSGGGDDGGAQNTEEAEAGPPQPGGILHLSTPSEPPTIDPHKESNARTHGLIGYVYSKLVDYKTGPDLEYGSEELEGDLAESWEQSEDGLTWTFHLRQGVKFHNIPPVSGREFTSADVMCTLDRIRDLPGQQAYQLDLVDSWAAPDPYTVVFNMKAPYPDLEKHLAGHFMWMLPCEGTQGQFDVKTQAIGTGPFMLEEWVRDQQRVYAKNPDYFVEGKPYLDGIEVSIVKDDGAAISAFRTEKLDALVGVADQSQLDLVTSQMPEAVVREEWSYSPTLLYMNQAVEPFDDPRVREAIGLAIDREKMSESLRPGEDEGGLMSGPVPPLLTGALPSEEALDLQPYDPEKAKDLLADAGFPDGFNVDLLVTDGYGPEIVSEAQWVQQDLAEIGINVQLDTQDYATYFATSWAGEDYTIGYGLQTPFLTADDYLTGMWSSEGSRNWFNISDPELDAMIAEQRSMLDEDQRVEAMQDIQRYILEEVHNPLLQYLPNSISLFAPYVHDYYSHPEYGSRHYINVWLDENAPGKSE